MQSTRVPVHSLYVLKAVCAFAVVMLHTEFILKMPLTPLLRLAVPLFFLISGYFLYDVRREQMLGHIRKSFGKAVGITIVANMIYLVFYLLQGETFRITWLSALRFLLLGDSLCGPLWYMTACIEALLFIWIFVKMDREDWLMYLTPVLFVLCLALGKYAWVWGFDAQSWMSRNGLLTAVPFLFSGCLLRKYEAAILSALAGRRLWLLLAAALLGCYAEYGFLHLLGLIQTGDVLITTIPTALLVFCLCLRFRTFGDGSVCETVGRKFSTDIYLYHQLCALCLLLVFGSGVFHAAWYRFAGSVVVFLLALGFAMLLHRPLSSLYRWFSLFKNRPAHIS